MALGLDLINWGQPWLRLWREVGERVALRVAQGLPVYEALNQERSPVVRFVPQSDLPAGHSYESFIFETQRCPTRDNLHDFFNGLCWLLYPQTKQRLNQLQAEQLATQGVQATRGPVRDALTLLDENAAFLVAPASVWQALQARDWLYLFVQRRELWQQAQLHLFGHALLEKLVSPRKPITAHVYWRDIAIDSVATLDVWVAQDVNAAKLATKPFTPLPVLGVPGWWAANEDAVFYDDTSVFRCP